MSIKKGKQIEAKGKIIFQKLLKGNQIIYSGNNGEGGWTKAPIKRNVITQIKTKNTVKIIKYEKNRIIVLFWLFFQIINVQIGNKPNDNESIIGFMS